MLVTGSFMGSRVMGHLMLILSEATVNSSLTAAGWLPATATAPPVAVSGVSSENHVDECGMGGASSSGNWASWTSLLKPT